MGNQPDFYMLLKILWPFSERVSRNTKKKKKKAMLSTIPLLLPLLARVLWKALLYIKLLKITRESSVSVLNELRELGIRFYHDP